MNEEEKEAIEYYKNKEISFSVDYDKAEFLKALGIEEKEEDNFENNQIRFKTLLNLICKQQKEIENSISNVNFEVINKQIDIHAIEPIIFLDCNDNLILADKVNELITAVKDLDSRLNIIK